MESIPGRGTAALNAGPSSVRFAVFSSDHVPTHRLSGAIDGVGRDQVSFRVNAETGTIWADESRHVLRPLPG